MNNRHKAQKELNAIWKKQGLSAGAQDFGYKKPYTDEAIKKKVLAKASTMRKREAKIKILSLVGLERLSRLIKTPEEARRLVEEIKKTFGPNPELISVRQIASELRIAPTIIKILIRKNILTPYLIEVGSNKIIYLDKKRTIKELQSDLVRETLLSAAPTITMKKSREVTLERIRQTLLDITT